MTQFPLVLPPPETRFSGDTYSPEQDCERLTGQLWKVWFRLKECGEWWTLAELAASCGCSEASASARLRDLRKAKFGGHTIERRRIGNGGLHEYRLAA